MHACIPCTWWPSRVHQILYTVQKKWVASMAHAEKSHHPMACMYLVSSQKEVLSRILRNQDVLYMWMSLQACRGSA
jgi:hypothetical protein